MTLFNSNLIFGDDNLSPAEVLVNDILKQRNFELLKFFSVELEGLLSKSAKKDIDWLISYYEAGHFEYKEMVYSEYVSLFKNIVKALEKKHNVKIECLKWMDTIDNIIKMFDECGYDDVDYLNQIQAYQEGICIYTDDFGFLYAYSSKPIQLSKDVVETYLNSSKEVFRVYLHYAMEPIYFNHQNISIEEIANYCVKHNKGLWYTTEMYDELNINEDNEGFVYVDLSGYNKPNIMLSIDNLIAVKPAEIYS